MKISLMGITKDFHFILMKYISFLLILLISALPFLIKNKGEYMQ